MCQSDQGFHSEPVPQVVCAWVDGGGADSHGRGDRAQGLLDGVALHRGARGGDEERRRPRVWTQPVTLGGVALQGRGGGGVQRHQPYAVELGVADRDHTGDRVDVVSGQADHLAQAHAGDDEQPEHGLERGGPQPGMQPFGVLHHPSDVGP